MSEKDLFKVLIIEDSLTYQQALKRAFEAKGYVVRCTGRGEEGLEEVKKMKPHLVVADLMLPGIDGREVCRQIKMNMNYRHIPIMMLTFQKEDKAVIEGVEAGADSYVNKSESMEVILKRAESLIKLSLAAGPVFDESAGAEEEIALTGKDLLLVDDDLTFLYGMKRLFETEGYKVRTAMSGEDCFARLREKIPDILLLDLRMPEIDGVDVCRQVRKMDKYRDLPVVMLTASDSSEDVIRSFEAGVSDYVIKNSDFKLIKLRIYSILRRKHFEQETQKIRAKLTDAETRALIANAEKEAEKKFAEQLGQKNGQLESLYQELEKKNRDLGRLNELKSDFVSTVSHELRTPMAIMKEAVSQVMEGMVGPVTVDQQRYLEMSLQNISRLERIINDLLDISKIEAGKIELYKGPLDIVKVVRQVVAGFQLRTQEKKLELKTFFSSVEIGICADHDKLIQILTNLIGNAFKFTSAGSITVRVTEKDDGIECAVEDTGLGIPLEDQARIFEKFEQVKRHQTSGVKGTGLGLAIASGLVLLHRGKIWVESEVGKGTAFIFSLPKVSAKDYFEEVLASQIKISTQRNENLSAVLLTVKNIEVLRRQKGLEGARQAVSDGKHLIETAVRTERDKVVYYDNKLLLVLPRAAKEDADHVMDRVRTVLNAKPADLNPEFEERIISFPSDGVTAEELLKKLGLS